MARWRGFDDAWIEPLTLLMPELKQQRANLTSEHYEHSRTVLFESIRRILLGIAEKQKILVPQNEEEGVPVRRR